MSTCYGPSMYNLSKTFANLLHSSPNIAFSELLNDIEFS